VRDGIVKGWSNFVKARRKLHNLPVHEILLEAKKLRRVSDNLDVLATQHAPLAEALTVLSGNVRNSATLLEVLVELKMGPEPGLESASN
jgi:hypothetical protein